MVGFTFLWLEKQSRNLCPPCLIVLHLIKLSCNRSRVGSFPQDGSYKAGRRIDHTGGAPAPGQSQLAAWREATAAQNQFKESKRISPATLAKIMYCKKPRHCLVR